MDPNPPGLEDMFREQVAYFAPPLRGLRATLGPFHCSTRETLQAACPA